MTMSETPRARAASTYVVSRITSTEPRTMRATRGAYTIPMATMTLATLGPSEAISAMARMMAGKAMSPSITRITGLSSRRQYPAASPQTSPTANASSTTAAPTSSESRAPYTTRLHTSRPTSSVPNQWAAPGAVRRAETSIRSGSPAMTGASAPTTVVIASSTRPTRVARRRTSRVSQSARRRTGSAGRGSARTLILAGAARPAHVVGGLRLMVCGSAQRRRPTARGGLRLMVCGSAQRRRPTAGGLLEARAVSLVSHAGIEDDVGEIDGEVHQHVDAGDADHHALDDGIVAPQDGRDDEPPEPGDVEDLLDDHGARDEDRERDADHGDRRDHRVLQRVLVDDGALAQPLGA